MSEKSLLTILAPMYTPDERETTRKIMVYLRKQGFAVYQPYDDGLESGLFPILARSTSPAPADKGRENHRAILLSCALDYYKLAVQSDACILIMDGRVPDEGAIFWAAVAFASGKPVILFKNDYRWLMQTGDNAMISGLSSDFTITGDLDRLPARVASHIQKYKTQGKAFEYTFPPYNRKLIELGHEITRYMNNRNGPAGVEVIQDVLNHFGSTEQVNTLIPDEAVSKGDAKVLPPGKVYCSGPLFCPSEIREAEKISAAFEKAGLNTYLPHRDGVEARMGLLDNFFLRTAAALTKLGDKDAFGIDVFELIECQYFIINTNGRVPDDGAVSETGMAFALGKPVVLYRSDPRNHLQGSHGFLHPAIQMGGYLFNPAESADRIFDHMAAIKSFRDGFGFDPDTGMDNVSTFVKKWYDHGAKCAKRLGKAFKKKSRPVHPYTNWPDVPIH
jgi:nucleoside 2-deoxyribosyltransferase